MKTTTRGHLKNKLQANEANDARITRPSRWGNDFHIGEDHPDTGLPMTRDDVCDLFEERQLPFMDVEPLRGKRLLCSCPLDKRCHGDSIIKKLEETPMNLRNDKLQEAAELITKDHQEIQQLMATAEERAKAIGQKLVDLKPILKERGTNLTDFCKDYLPFGKSTAYDYIKIAEGKVTWEDHIKRGNSEPSEKLNVSLDETPQKALGMIFEGEECAIKGWLQCGAALNAGRKLLPNDEQFEQWVRDEQLDTYGSEEERTAAMWAAEDPEGFKEVRKAYPGVRAVSDLHAKWRDGSNSQPSSDSAQAIANTVAPKEIDLGAIARNKEHTDIRKIGPAFIANMEILCTKFDRKDIERELVAFMEPDPLGLKVKALHTMAEILIDLCGEYPLRSQEKKSADDATFWSDFPYH